MPIRTATTPDKRTKLLEVFLGAGSWTYSIQARDIFWSPGLYALLGLDPHTVIPSRDLYDTMIHPEDRLSHEEIVERAEAGELAVRRFRMIRPDGRLLWLESKSQREYDRQGGLSFLHGVVQDVTDDQKVRSENARIRQAVMSMKKITGADFWRTDAEGRMLDTANWAQFTGVTPERLKDHEALTAIHPDDRDIVRRARETGIRLKQEVQFTVRVLGADGNYRNVEHKVVPVVMDGQLVEWHGMSWINKQAVSDSDEAPLLRACHIRAARALIGMTARELAEAVGLSFSTVRRIEDDVDAPRSSAMDKIRFELTRRGISFSAGADGAVTIALKPGTGK